MSAQIAPRSGVTSYGVVAGMCKLWFPTPHTASDLLPLAGAWLWVVGTLPSAVMAWTLPDHEPDPGQEEVSR